jgi:hypothetical protein
MHGHNDTMIDEPAPGFSAKPTLTGEKVVLRPFILEADAPALREMLQDPEAIRLTGGGGRRLVRHRGTWTAVPAVSCTSNWSRP